MIRVIDLNVSTIDYEFAVATILNWAKAGESRYICIANVHVLMEVHDSSSYKAVLDAADMVTPDGMPLVWMMRLKGCYNQNRVYGPTLMLQILEQAESENISIGFYGSKVEVLELLIRHVSSKYPKLNINYVFSPPFRNLNQTEDKQIIDAINRSKVRILFVGLGCPRQEKWMAEHRGEINVVMLGVGAAFDFHAGVIPQAPLWVQNIGMEWFYRLITEPRRLWRRYFYHNPRFIFLAILDLFGILRKWHDA